jgi:ATP-dependent helicase HrpA
VKEWRTVRAALEGIRSATFAEALADVNAQLQQLLPPDFLTATERPWLDYLPRYLKAIARRLDRLPGNLKRDMELSGIVKPFAAAFRELAARPSTALAAREGLDSLRWMIEEFRVSLFAQDLKTVTRVSEKRLTEQLELVRVKANG